METTPDAAASQHAPNKHETTNTFNCSRKKALCQEARPIQDPIIFDLVVNHISLFRFQTRDITLTLNIIVSEDNQGSTYRI